MSSSSECRDEVSELGVAVRVQAALVVRSMLAQTNSASGDAGMGVSLLLTRP